MNSCPPSSLFAGDVPALLLDEETRAVCINPDKSLVKWQWQTARVNNAFPFTMSANATDQATVTINAEEGLRGDTEICAFMITSTGRVACQPYIGSPLDKNLSNIAIPTSLMFGTSQLPGILPISIYNLPATSWRLAFTDLSGNANTISAVFFGRRFLDRGRERLADARRVAFFSQNMHPYWIGPRTGPEISLTAGGTTILEFPVPSSADFDCRYILDDTSSSTGLAPSFTAQITEGDSARALIDLPAGVSFRDFIATPTVSVTGFPGTPAGTIRAMSLAGPGCGWSHLFKRTTVVRIAITSTDAGTLTLRMALAGTLLYAPEGPDRMMSQDSQAIAQRHAQASGAETVRMFGSNQSPQNGQWR